MYLLRILLLLFSTFCIHLFSYKFIQVHDLLLVFFFFQLAQSLMVANKK